MDRHGRIRGCLLGGAVGDALGYPVEFMTAKDIRRQYGSEGMIRYAEPDGDALFSDDTQMTLFTACGLLYGITHRNLLGDTFSLPVAIHRAYLDWFASQQGGGKPRAAWILRVPELCDRRAPGATCTGALALGMMGSCSTPINSSKGCGGVMRVAPIGLYPMTTGQSVLLGAEAAAITHGHPLGYLSAAALACIIHQLVFNEPLPLDEIVTQSGQTLKKLFPDSGYVQELSQLLDRAAELARADMRDEAAIAKLGEGWVGEEALAIAVYCCLRHRASFEDAVTAAVNHSGDSDSTGAITGNIMGAMLGDGAIPSYYTDRLELRWLIEELADDLYDGVPDEPDARWMEKYGFQP